MNQIYLSCTFDSKKSFYNKAYYVREGNELRLYSYDTHVLSYDNISKLFTEPYYSHHSSTTNRHVREFMRQIEAGMIN